LRSQSYPPPFDVFSGDVLKARGTPCTIRPPTRAIVEAMAEAFCTSQSPRRPAAHLPHARTINRLELINVSRVLTREELTRVMEWDYKRGGARKPCAWGKPAISERGNSVGEKQKWMTTVVMTGGAGRDSFT